MNENDKYYVVIGFDKEEILELQTLRKLVHEKNLSKLVYNLTMFGSAFLFNTETKMRDLNNFRDRVKEES